MGTWSEFAAVIAAHEAEGRAIAMHDALDVAIAEFGMDEREYRVWFKSNGFAVVDVYTDDDVQVPLAQVRSNDDGPPDIVRF